MQAEAIYKGATRPAMKLGVPLIPLVLLAGTSMLTIMWAGSLVSWWVAPGVVLSALPTWLWMRWVTAKDDQRFRQMGLLLRLRMADRNQAHWLARSYSPNLYRGTRDAWHA